jgi:hypothetical protein
VLKRDEINVEVKSIGFSINSDLPFLCGSVSVADVAFSATCWVFEHGNNYRGGRK